MDKLGFSGLRVPFGFRSSSGVWRGIAITQAAGAGVVGFDFFFGFLRKTQTKPQQLDKCSSTYSDGLMFMMTVELSVSLKFLFVPLSIFIVGHGYGPIWRLHHKILHQHLSWLLSLSLTRN